MEKFITSQFKTEPESTLDKLNKAMVAQKRTSLHKALVYLVPSEKKVVYKGPFAWPNKCDMLAHMLFRRELFADVWGGCAVSGPFELFRIAGNDKEVYIRMPHINANDFDVAQSAPAASQPSWMLDGEKNVDSSSAAANMVHMSLMTNKRAHTSAIDGFPAWTCTRERILGEEATRLVPTKLSQGFMELSEYLLLPAEDRTASTLASALIHFMHRYICLVGDAAPRNVLIKVGRRWDHEAVGIDYEENRTGGEDKREQERAGGFFGMICGGKKWSKDTIRLLDDVLQGFKATFVEHLVNDVDTKWPAVELLLKKHGMFNPIRLQSMKDRTKALIDVLKPPEKKRKFVEEDDSEEDQPSKPNFQ